MFNRPINCLFLTIALLPAWGHAGASEALTNLFFPFDSGVGRGKWTPQQQAQTLKEIGFDGIGYNFQRKQPELIEQWLSELHRRGLKLIDIYAGIDFPKQPGERPWEYLREPIRRLKGTETMIWAPIWGAKHDEQRDEEILPILNEIADWCEASGIRLCLYAHGGAYSNTADDCLRLARKVNRPKLVGVSINVCHEYAGGNIERLTQLPKEMGQYLFLVSVNGLNRQGGGILRLDAGDFDLFPFIRALHEAGYGGPIGIQCIGRAGDIQENLRLDMKQWQAWNSRLARGRK